MLLMFQEANDEADRLGHLCCSNLLGGLPVHPLCTC